jgi:hypothetical protein
MVVISLLIAANTNVFAAGIGATLADGKAWTMQTPEGKNVQVTFLPDGTGKMKAGFMGMGLKWREDGNLFCMKPGFMKERCSEMRAVQGGYDTYIDGKKVGSLRR